MKTRRILAQFLLYCLVLIVGLGACRPTATPQPLGPGAANTAAAQTIAAQLTNPSGYSAIAQLTEWAIATASAPPATPTPEPPTLTPAPSHTPTIATLPPTLTRFVPSLTPTVTAAPCNQAEFVKDVSALPGSVLTRGADFTKIWRLRNIGSCTWTSGYTLEFVRGDRMSSPSSVPLSSDVPPGQEADISVELTTPTKAGDYRGYWNLRSASGEFFGVGPNADQSLEAAIRVMANSGRYAYDFAHYMCDATWVSSAASLPCPGDTEDPNGSVVLLDRPTMEDGKQEDEPTLWTRPQEVQSGWIKGTYPEYKVEDGDHFVAVVGCLKDSVGCSATFYLDYQIKDQAVVNLGFWGEFYDGILTVIDVDLSALEGKKVQFILGVTSTGEPTAANAFWLSPSIRWREPTPTPTSIPLTPTPTQPDSSAAVQAARSAVAQGIGVNPNQVIVVTVEPAYWGDTCLELPNPGEICNVALIYGYRIGMFVGTRQFEAHTNSNGSEVRWREY